MKSADFKNLRVTRWVVTGAKGLSSSFKWLGALGDPLSKWATVIAVIAGGAWAYYQFWQNGADDWAVNLSVNSEVLPYTDKTALLVIHIRAKNPRPSVVDIDRTADKYIVSVTQIPDNLTPGSVINPDDDPAPQTFSKTINFAPIEYELLPGADFEDSTSVVVPLGMKVWINAEMDYDGDFVNTSAIATIPPAHRDSPASATSTSGSSN